jgi:hypothetical protein
VSWWLFFRGLGRSLGFSSRGWWLIIRVIILGLFSLFLLGFFPWFIRGASYRVLGGRGWGFFCGPWILLGLRCLSRFGGDLFSRCRYRGVWCYEIGCYLGLGTFWRGMVFGWRWCLRRWGCWFSFVRRYEIIMRGYLGYFDEW